MGSHWYHGSNAEAEQATALCNPMPYLRAATSERHRRLEEHLNLLRSDFTSNDYVEILSRFYGFWQPWEDFAEKSVGGDLLLFFQARRRSAKICHDLQQLGLSDAQILALPIATHLPALHSVDAALGSMYVMEGSTLGGQRLSRHFMDRAGIDPEQCTFFRGHGFETGLMWKQFGSEIAKRPQSSYCDMAMAANETFACLEEWLCQ